MLDLRTLAFALTDRSSRSKALASSSASSTASRKPPRHGVITPEYIDYNRRDVLASTELAAQAYSPNTRCIRSKLQVTKAYSPASIGKAYLQAWRDADHGADAGFPKSAIAAIPESAFLRRPCKRARAQGSGAGRLIRISLASIRP